MAKKIVKKKAGMKERSDDSPLTKREIAYYQKLVASIGSRKQRGYLFIAEATKDEASLTVNSLGFVNGISRIITLKNLLAGMGAETMEM